MLLFSLSYYKYKLSSLSQRIGLLYAMNLVVDNDMKDVIPKLQQNTYTINVSKFNKSL